ncbi:hypothetical protein B0H14DRAFT_3159045 [Mycena olivaceomarginata]|nr:hypothetical protein B0H14DRAFT_3159045 [Mycena olivaceomarginata]
MDSAKHHQVIQQILSPTLNANEKDEILNDLGLNGLPSREHALELESIGTFVACFYPLATAYERVANVRASTGLTSTSLGCTPGLTKNFVRGRSGYVPFCPGGLEDAAISGNPESQSKAGFRTISPGFTRGLHLPEDADDSVREAVPIGEDELATLELSRAADADTYFDEVQDAAAANTGNEIDKLLPTTRSHLKPVKTSRRVVQHIIQKRDWVHVIDVNTPLGNSHELVPEMAHKYPFELDTFQKQAVYHLEMGDYVFVAAHTSAGKTVVAEYAIALAEKYMTRAIYMSPIKALSNQKFRDFKQTFSPSSVGILTGDVQINPGASCLIMTTEILQGMLEALSGLLSATVLNTKEFADWVGRTKKKDIYVISTAQRPVPLEHYLYASREMYKIVNARRNFLALGYKEAGEALQRKQDKEREAAGLLPVQRVGARGAAPPQRGQQRGRGTPAPKRCEENVATLTNADLCSSVEKSEVHVAIKKALSRLKGSDKKLPQIGQMRDLLSRGIGAHHSGLLPIVKEVACGDPLCSRTGQDIVCDRDLCDGQSLWSIKSMYLRIAQGVNMPAKCVVFSGIRKHDGRGFRDILPGEYKQMAGRAGRRGLDPTGTVVIVANDSLPEQTTLQTMMLGTPGKLSSQFRLTYNMILNLLRVEALKVEEMIKRSFSENASQRLLPDQQKQVLEVGLNLLANVSSARHQSLASGRVVVLRDSHFKSNNLAVLLKAAPVTTSESGVLEKVKTYFVLALADADAKTQKQDIAPHNVEQVRAPPSASKLSTPPFAPSPLASVRICPTLVADVLPPLLRDYGYARVVSAGSCNTTILTLLPLPSLSPFHRFQAHRSALSCTISLRIRTWPE